MKFRRSTRASRAPAGGHVRRLSAAEFKATCLELMNVVRETGAEVVVTKHGRPVARLVRFGDPAPAGFFGSMAGTVLAYDRPFDPIDGDYDINRD